MNGHEQTNPKYKTDETSLLREFYWESRCELAEKLLKHVLTEKEIGRACHIHDLEAKVRKLRNELTYQREAAEYRNRQLKAVNLVVSCYGCDAGLIGDPESINESMVFEVEQIAIRLRKWWECHTCKEESASEQ